MKKNKKIIMLFFLLIMIYFFINALSIYNYSLVDEKRKVDVGIVLGAATYNGEVSKVYAERLHHAVKLYNEHYIDKIIVTGGTQIPTDVSDARAAYNYLISIGIPKNDIIIEEKSTITEENLANSKMIIEKEGFKEAIIISDPLHMKRSMLLADNLGMTAYSSPTGTSRYISLKTKVPFLARETFFYISYKWYNFFRNIRNG